MSVYHQAIVSGFSTRLCGNTFDLVFSVSTLLNLFYAVCFEQCFKCLIRMQGFYCVVDIFYDNKLKTKAIKSKSKFFR